MKTAKKKSVLIIDDEPHALNWLVEFLEAQGHQVTVVSDFASAISAVSDKRHVHDLVTVDLMMPILGPDQARFAAEPIIFSQFPGLYLARAARNAGYGSSKVVAYSVHDRSEIEKEADRIGFDYAVKGRPRDLKDLLTRRLANR